MRHETAILPNKFSELLGLAFSATVHCLTGCAIGEVLGVAIGTALGWSDFETILLAVGLAFFFGYSLAMLPLVRAGITFRRAIGLALAADTISIATMELIDNAIILAVPGAMDAGLDSALFWGSLAFALAVAFAVTLPVNMFLISRGWGHATVHEIHEGHETQQSHEPAPHKEAHHGHHA
jgi:Domain of unknown function (DUF4396)